jgi:hypothetical protein
VSSRRSQVARASSLSGHLVRPHHRQQTRGVPSAVLETDVLVQSHGSLVSLTHAERETGTAGRPGSPLQVLHQLLANATATGVIDHADDDLGQRLAGHIADEHWLHAPCPCRPEKFSVLLPANSQLVALGGQPAAGMWHLQRIRRKAVPWRERCHQDEPRQGGSVITFEGSNGHPRQLVVPAGRSLRQRSQSGDAACCTAGSPRRFQTRVTVGAVMTELPFPDPPLTDEVLRLRPWLRDDIDAAHAAVQDPLTPRFTRVPESQTE